VSLKAAFGMRSGAAPKAVPGLFVAVLIGITVPETSLQT
jgi:hypothetical protein